MAEWLGAAGEEAAHNQEEEADCVVAVGVAVVGSLDVVPEPGLEEAHQFAPP